MSWFDTPRMIRAALLDNATVIAAVVDRVHYQQLPQESTLPHVWFSRNSKTEDDMLSDDEGLIIETYSVEIISTTNAEDLVDAVADTLAALEGESGDQFVSLVDVTDADDQYQFQSAGAGDAAYLHALQLTVYIT